MSRELILSRHRLPHPYRILLTVLWVTPSSILFLTLLVQHGLTASLLDPRFWLPALVMCLPALYVWREGVDVLSTGIIARVHIPRYYPYTTLGTWYLDSRPDKRVLTVWDTHSRKVLECRPGHLTDLPTLLAALKANVRYRNWPL
jgi:hypothetical protein